MVSDEYRDFVLEQLRRATSHAITHRPMFGGVGIYADGAFFAILAEDTVYLKVDDANRPDFEAAGTGPFLPFGDADRPMRGYWRLPGEVLEEPEELGGWVEKAVAVAGRARAGKQRG